MINSNEDIFERLWRVFFFRPGESLAAKSNMGLAVFPQWAGCHVTARRHNEEEVCVRVCVCLGMTAGDNDRRQQGEQQILLSCAAASKCLRVVFFLCRLPVDVSSLSFSLACHRDTAMESQYNWASGNMEDTVRARALFLYLFIYLES